MRESEARFSTPIFEFSEKFDSLKDHNRKELVHFTFTKNRLRNFLRGECQFHWHLEFFDKNKFLSTNKIKIDIFKSAMDRVAIIDCYEMIFKRLSTISLGDSPYGFWLMEAVFEEKFFNDKMIKLIRNYIVKDKMDYVTNICRALPQYNYFLILS